MTDWSQDPAVRKARELVFRQWLVSPERSPEDRDAMLEKRLDAYAEAVATASRVGGEPTEEDRTTLLQGAEYARFAAGQFAQSLVQTSEHVAARQRAEQIASALAAIANRTPSPPSVHREADL